MRRFLPLRSGRNAAAGLALTLAITAATAVATPRAYAAPDHAAPGPAAATSSPLPQHVVVVFLDGPRFTETLGRPQQIPWLLRELAPHGAVLTEFYNRGTTKTVSGHSSGMTGTWQSLRNDGTERPHAPTMFELLRAQRGLPATATWVIAGKAKLRAVSHSDHPDYGVRFAACDSVDLGPDDHTCAVLRGVLAANAPRLVLVNFGDIDLAGHDEQWDLYLRRIAHADSLLGVLWSAIEQDPQLKGTTTLLVTYDHGRHDNRPDRPHEGFKDHGDDCNGCRHIALYARGCGIREGVRSAQPRTLCDLGATVARMLGISRNGLEGEPIAEIIAPDLSASAPTAMDRSQPAGARSGGQ